MSKNPSRRGFIRTLGTGISAAWVTTHWSEILAAQQHVHTAQSQGALPKLQFFSAEQAAQVEALASQIIPTDETPGAREAGVLYFIDRALSTFDRERRPAYTRGLKRLSATSRKLFPQSGGFQKLARDQQIQVLEAIEKSEFFELVRTHTLIGFFANPEYGGNRNKLGWKLIGFDDEESFTPPFGYYDRNYKGGEW